MKSDLTVENVVFPGSYTSQHIESYFREHYKKFVKKMYFRTGTEADAEDVVQESFARALKYAPKARIEHFGKWFSLVLTNTLRDHMNASKGYSAVEEEDVPEESVDCNGYPKRVMQEIRELVATKSAVQIEVLEMHLFEEYTAKEISEITPYSYAQVHQIILRFRNELKTLYKE